ncbi:DUF1643 domain-containing protein [Sphaerisporangium sp. NPDC049002]|uniref:DUF1643 domain-containing protein n=1 Tax=Sphaerisporangium sp. NPDC049002 TaxID=3155392 RepID=UPI003407DFCA
MATPAMMRAAVLSSDGCYRYHLARRWAEGAAVTFVMLNPSTADHHVDDPTIRRCVGFARAWGYGGLAVVNLFAWRATRPVDLGAAGDPVGPDNDEHLVAAARDAVTAGAPLVAAWGAHAPAWRVEQVLALPGMRGLTALALTQAGHPRHPLYLRATLKPQPWNTVEPINGAA